MRILSVGLAGLFVLLWVNVAAAEDSNVCKFTVGPLAGQTQDVDDSGSVGSACNDGHNKGKFVETPSGAEIDSAYDTDTMASSSGPQCVFDHGKLAGNQMDLTYLLAHKGKKSGNTCTASDGSYGEVHGGR